MQNQNNQTNQSKGFFSKGLNVMRKIKDGITGETQKKTTAEIADLKKYLDFGTKMGIVSDVERTTHEAKISVLESQIAKNKLDGIKTLESLAGKGKDFFAMAKSIDWKVLINRGKSVGLGLGMATMSFLGNPAMAANLPTNSVQADNPIKVENAVSNIPVINSVEDAIKNQGTVEPGMIIRVDGRNIKVVGDGKNVNLLESYRFAKKKLFSKTPSTTKILPILENIKNSPAVPVKTVVPSNSVNTAKPTATQIIKKIIFPSQPARAPEISAPVQPQTPPSVKTPSKVNTPNIKTGVVPEIINTIPAITKPIQLPEIKKSAPPIPMIDNKKDSAIFVPPVISKPISQPSDTSLPIIKLPTNSVEDPFKIVPPAKPTNILDDILKIKPQVKPDFSTAPVLDIPEIEPNKPNIAPIKPNIPFVKPPVPPRPNLDNYKPKPVNENKIPAPESPKTQEEIKPPISDTIREIQGIETKVKLNELLPPVTHMSVKTKMAELNSTRYTNPEEPDQVNKIEGGWNTRDGFIGQVSVKFNWGGAPDRVSTIAKPVIDNNKVSTPTFNPKPDNIITGLK